MKEENKHIDFDALIAKSFADQLSGDEKSTLENWLAESDANRKHFNALKLVWEKGTMEPSWKPNPDQVNAAWKNVERKIKKKPAGKVIRLPQFLAVAASLALLISLVFWLKPETNNVGEMIASTGEAADTINLSDGSEVILAPHSSLAYLEEFSKEERNVTLTGSAQFSVTGNKKRPFKISTANSIVEVVGTKFVVNQVLDSVFVEVTEGTVRLYESVENESEKTEVISIRKGQSAYRKDDREPVYVDDVADDITFNNLYFEAEKMKFVLAEMEDLYQVTFEVEDAEFLNCVFTTKLTGASLEEFLETISLVFDVEVSTSASRIFIKGKGC